MPICRMVIAARLGNDAQIVEVKDHVVAAVEFLENLKSGLKVSRRFLRAAAHVRDPGEEIQRLGGLYLIVQFARDRQGLHAVWLRPFQFAALEICPTLKLKRDRKL